MPIDGVSRANFPPGQANVDVELTTSRKNNTFQPGDDMVIYVTNRSHKPIYAELIGRSNRGRMVILAPSTTVIGPQGTYRYPPQGSIKIRGGLGKEQIILYASTTAFGPGELLRGDYVTDRVVHPFYYVRKEGNRLRLIYDVQYLTKRTIEIETK